MKTLGAAIALPALLATLLTGPPAGAAAAAAVEPNPWLEQRVLNMAHSGGELEAPTNTMYAFKRAVQRGADMIELDVQSTRDKKLVVLHDATVDETTDGSGKVESMPLRRVRRLDAAYWFVPRRGTTHDAAERRYRFRGVRTGDRPAPDGYKRSDFAVPTLAQVFRRFPEVPINIEIKGTKDSDTASYLRTGRLLAELVNESGRSDVIVTSFNDAAVADFHARSPQTALAPGMQGLMTYFLGGARPIEGTVALQVPVTYSGIPVVTREFVARAHADGYAVHVWFSGTAPDDGATYNAMIDACVDGLMPARPTLLERILDRRGIERPGVPGVDPCA
ncbi:glycerophosphodiester phosphodiesterase [Nocardioides sediminis]|uniref:glycerophosphodiester phosphodiesterase n=1 Tax=Nocardioides sediminis TaxID=433648 RepID=UPI0018FFCD1B|nr:glycerophosphodiester phosphodiesterase [Nocardioides sediminis]